MHPFCDRCFSRAGVGGEEPCSGTGSQAAPIRSNARERGGYNLAGAAATGSPATRCAGHFTNQPKRPGRLTQSDLPGSTKE